MSALAALLMATALAACSSSPPPVTVTAAPVGQKAVARAPYVALGTAIRQAGAQVWVETDLVKAWLGGQASYEKALATSLDLAHKSHAVGMKIADELGYRDGTDPEKATAFLARATSDIHAADPQLKVLIDVMAPELGCLSFRADAAQDSIDCGRLARVKDPATALDVIDGYLSAGGVDVLDLTPGLREDSWYARRGLNRDTAMRVAWQEAVRRWGTKTQLQARKALAHPGTYTATPKQAEADLHTFVDIPLESGAKAVDLWTWSQTYQGQTVRLTDPKIRPNALTRAIQERRRRGAKIWTHMTPSSLQIDLRRDVAAITSQFDAVFIAAGTG